MGARQRTAQGKDNMAKKSVKQAATRSSTKRELINTGTDARYVKRSADGTFKESDDVGRSQRADRARTAKKTVKPGYGDQGDQKKRTAKTAAKKR
jgi:hypothetical protein